MAAKFENTHEVETDTGSIQCHIEMPHVHWAKDEFEDEEGIVPPIKNTVTIQSWMDGIDLIFNTKKEVCPRCNGEGKHTNPSIDGNGITQSEMDELGDEFRRDYLSGLYDITCTECKGLRVIDVVDEENNTVWAIQTWNDHQNEEMDYRRMQEMEMRMGA